MRLKCKITLYSTIINLKVSEDICFFVFLQNKMNKIGRTKQKQKNNNNNLCLIKDKTNKIKITICVYYPSLNQIETLFSMSKKNGRYRRYYL